MFKILQMSRSACLAENGLKGMPTDLFFEIVGCIRGEVRSQNWEERARKKVFRKCMPMKYFQRQAHVSDVDAANAQRLNKPVSKEPTRLKAMANHNGQATE